MARVASLSRVTKEATINASVNLDGDGRAKIETGIKYLDHMLNTLAYHSLIDITLEARGDLVHHTSEDTAICLGGVIRRALGDTPRIRRFGYASIPMDDALADAALDLGGRRYCTVELKVTGLRIEDMAVEDVYHFIRSFSDSLQANIHIHVHYGTDDHHKVEAAFKALALALRQAVEEDPRRKDVPSTKGVI